VVEGINAVFSEGAGRKNEKSVSEIVTLVCYHEVGNRNFIHCITALIL
jgi:hypothetical protein